MNSSLYIHIPFCRRRCLYCDFYSTIHDIDTAKRYIDVIAQQIDALEGGFSTAYIGGGTPTVLENDILSGLLKSVKKVVTPGAEWTVEANPDSLDDQKLSLMRECGVNRLSIGVQSLKEEKLKRLGRIHGVRKAVESIDLAAKKGFSNISIDLIFGVWGENLESWQTELEEATALPATHVSCYQLTYEKGTPLFEAMKNKSVVPLDDDTVAEMYACAIDKISVRGFEQYEVSNFARANFQCRHNLNYWNNDPYAGIGASAVSYVDGVRQSNVSDVKEYIKRYDEGRSLVASSEKLDPVRSAKETAAVKIRTKGGIDFAWFKEKTGFDLLELEKKALPKLIDQGLIKYTRAGQSVTGIRLNRQGFLFCDTVSSELL